jgi:zinc transport system ATP-binding protein
MSDYAIEVDHVWFAYEGKEDVLRDVSLSLRKGEFLGIIGPNGGGKTTLLKLMLGILKPGRGKIRILGREPEKATHRVGYVPQGMDFSRHFPISVVDVALMGLARHARGG